jgi:Rho GTPase-activating protein 39
MWWELKDPSSGKPYYYNEQSGVTEWSRPVDGAIIQLDKLQDMQNSMAEAEGGTAGPISPMGGKSPKAPAAPAAAPGPMASPALEASKKKSRKVSVMKIVQYEANFASHSAGCCGGAIPTEVFLAWSKGGLPKPMLQLVADGPHKKAALDMFKEIQMYMGDRARASGKTPSQVALSVVTTAWSTPELRDELYLQLSKQTEGNDNIVTCEKGWELMAIATNFVPATKKFSPFIEGYIGRHTTGSQVGRVQQYAEHCLKKLIRIHEQGAKKGVKAVTESEVQQAQKNIFDPSMFSSSLEEIMEAQQRFAPADLAIPWVVTTLVEAVLESGAQTTEGIFRVPGDIDAVNMLKVALDRGEKIAPGSFGEPHVPASTLKMWFRELSDPLIPEVLYEECVNASRDIAASLAALDKMPALNRKLLTYIVRFLQVVGDPDNHATTKMNHENLSMVWAPNFLRCPSDNPMEILQFAKREMTFTRNLVTSLDTDSVKGLPGLPAA